MFAGSYTALVTPFRDGQVDYEAFEALIEEQASAAEVELADPNTYQADSSGERVAELSAIREDLLAQIEALTGRWEELEERAQSG